MTLFFFSKTLALGLAEAFVLAWHFSGSFIDFTAFIDALSTYKQISLLSIFFHLIVWFDCHPLSGDSGRINNCVELFSPWPCYVMLFFIYLAWRCFAALHRIMGCKSFVIFIVSVQFILSSFFFSVMRM